MSNNTKTMVDILESQVKLINGLEMVKCRELSSYYKVILSYNGINARESKLDKMCVVGKEIQFVRFFIETAITGLLLESNNMIEAKKWLNHEVWNEVKDISTNEYLVTILSKATLLCEVFKCTAKDIEDATNKGKNFIKENPDFYGDEIIQVHSTNIKEI